MAYCTQFKIGLQQYLPYQNMFNSLPNNKFLDWSKLKAFVDDRTKLTEKMKFILEMVENILGKGGNAGYQHFLLFPQYFQKTSYSRS